MPIFRSNSCILFGNWSAFVYNTFILFSILLLDLLLFVFLSCEVTLSFTEVPLQCCVVPSWYVVLLVMLCGWSDVVLLILCGESDVIFLLLCAESDVVLLILCGVPDVVLLIL